MPRIESWFGSGGDMAGGEEAMSVTVASGTLPAAPVIADASIVARTKA